MWVAVGDAVICNRQIAWLSPAAEVVIDDCRIISIGGLDKLIAAYFHIAAL